MAHSFENAKEFSGSTKYKNFFREFSSVKEEPGSRDRWVNTEDCCKKFVILLKKWERVILRTHSLYVYAVSTKNELTVSNSKKRSFPKNTDYGQSSDIQICVA